MNRGGQVTSEIVESCRSHKITDLILVHVHRGQPDGLVVCHLPVGPTAYFGLLNVIGERMANILKHLFPAPKPDSKRLITFANRNGYISFRFAFHPFDYIVSSITLSVSSGAEIILCEN
ncbi:uncharacterized protein LOC133896221 [Phragmites australis]|uniref:uncharacterized protein LOC133896221 n=1 Tax=Phragmites australis TaxID=29695 RepID=UPI002D77CEC4|nr:uncharacterized protein LOC133896221 [Phragmites australis]